MEKAELCALQVNSLLVTEGAGKQEAQLRMGIWWALKGSYQGIITIDGNNKDSIEDVPNFIAKLEEGYDFVQGSRFIPGGQAVNTPLVRYISLKLIHAPVISMTARHRFTDTTNAYRAYSRRYLEHLQVQPLRDVFVTYELLAYLSVRVSQLGMRVCEIPVQREYPSGGCFCSAEAARPRGGVCQNVYVLRGHIRYANRNSICWRGNSACFGNDGSSYSNSDYNAG